MYIHVYIYIYIYVYIFLAALQRVGDHAADHLDHLVLTADRAQVCK